MVGGSASPKRVFVRACEALKGSLARDRLSIDRPQHTTHIGALITPNVSVPNASRRQKFVQLHWQYNVMSSGKKVRPNVFFGKCLKC